MWAIFCDVFAPMNEENNDNENNQQPKSLYDSMVELQQAWRNFIMTVAEIYKLDKLLDLLSKRVIRKSK